MALEGLDYILNKQEVIPTVSAQDLVERPEKVDSDYKRHVRTYVPINRSAEGKEGQLSVDQFERRVIHQVKDGKAPRGYLTAEYGYGKTSTALYLWERAENENIIVVPPFQMLQLTDLITSIYGWVRYRLKGHSPHLIDPLDQLYEQTTRDSLEQEARANNVDIQTLREWAEQGRFILELQPADYIKWFENVTGIITEAGFDGLLVLPDEVQQYIEPSIARREEPITPLFNIIQGIATRESSGLKFGLVMVIPLKEIGLIRETRDDLLHRMRKLSLDLSAVYDFDFAQRLWNKLSEEFDFSQIASDIVASETLDSLGEIASRNDLSNGPRTVINTFRRMVQRYKNIGHANSQPYSPIDLVEDLMSGAIQFSGNEQIQRVTRRVLQSGIVRSDVDRYEFAVKLAAAFPSEGVPTEVQSKYNVETALDELMQKGIGELVIAVGPIDRGGITLFGLHQGVQQQEWLPQTIRDFRRAYREHHETTKERTIKVFKTLLQERVFNGWKLEEENPSSFVSNLSLIMEGDFPSFSSKYPSRRIQVRILWEDEERKDEIINGDVAIEYRLSMHKDATDRREITQPIEFEWDEHTVVIPINLMYVRPEGIPQQIMQFMRDVWSPYDLSPLVLMNIYQVLEEKRAANTIPRAEDQMIKSGLQPDFLDTILNDLFNEQVGAPLGGVTQVRVTELAILELLDGRYGDTYHTLMAVNSWKSSLRKYESALERLDNVYQRRGDVEFEGTKEEVANLMTLTNTGFDSFQRNFPDFVEIMRAWSGGKQGAVKFTLHDLETRIMRWLRDSGETDKVSVGDKSYQMHVIDINRIYEEAAQLGYRSDEITALLDLLATRELVEMYQRHRIRERPSETPDLDSIKARVKDFSQKTQALLDGFPTNNVLKNFKSNADTYEDVVEKQLSSGKPDPQQFHKLGRAIGKSEKDLYDFLSDQQVAVRSNYINLRKRLTPINPQYRKTLDEQITGGVSYVQQVNALRMSLRQHTSDLNSQIEHLSSDIDKRLSSFKPDDTMPIDRLARYASEVREFEDKLDNLDKNLSDFEVMYRHLSEWRRLVTEGSDLVSMLQQMEHTTKEQATNFDLLEREIRGKITAADDRLGVLPDHSIYADQLTTLRQQVITIRNEAVTQFTNLQNQYRQALTKSGLYQRHQLERPEEYNPSNPDSSYRKLYSYVQELVMQLREQLARVSGNEHQTTLNTIQTPLVKNLAPDNQNYVQKHGEDLLSKIEAINTDLSKAEEIVQDVTAIQDFGAEGTGEFDKLIDGFVSIRDELSSIHQDVDKLSTWLTELELSSDEEQLLVNVPSEERQTIDLVDLRRNFSGNDDKFWEVIRGLSEKHRMRITISRVRRS